MSHVQVMPSEPMPQINKCFSTRVETEVIVNVYTVSWAIDHYCYQRMKNICVPVDKIVDGRGQQPNFAYRSSAGDLWIIIKDQLLGKITIED